MPADKKVNEGIIKGLYCLEESAGNDKTKVQLIGCGSILQEVRAAAAGCTPDIGFHLKVITQDLSGCTNFLKNRATAYQLNLGLVVAGALFEAIKSFDDTFMTLRWNPISGVQPASMSCVVMVLTLRAGTC
jgi:hypothetical protein